MTRTARFPFYRRCLEARLTVASTAWLAGVCPKAVYIWARKNGVTFRKHGEPA